MRAAAVPAVRPRRVAGPARPLTVAPGPRRVSGPARREAGPQPVRRHSGEELGIAHGLLSSLAGLQRRLGLGGRTSIALVAFALIGIVTLQLGLLKLNAGIGHAIEREALLQRENAALSIENSELAASDRVTSQAERLGMQFTVPGALRFLTAHPGSDAAITRAVLGATTHGSGPTSGQGEGTSETALSAGQAEQQLTSTVASGESSDVGSAASGSAGPSSAGSPASASAGESASARTGEAPSPSGESTTGSSTSSSVSASQPATPTGTGTGAGAGAGAAPATGGGTRAGSSG